MMRPQPLPRLLHSLLVAALLVSTIAPTAIAQDNIYLSLVANGQTILATQLLFRTHVTITTAAQWHDLAALDLVILEQGTDWALLLVDDKQLATLARLRFNPTATNAVETLAAAD